MNKQPFMISIPTPCHESWQNMTPADKGRFCQSCQKIVTDFSGMSDQQIISYLKTRQGNVCGRFDTEQLNREISMPANTRKQPFAPIAAIVAALTIAIPSVQGKSKAEKIQLVPDRLNATLQRIDTLPYIKGIVIDIDGTDKYNLYGAAIRLKGQDIYSITDTSGKFELKIPGNYKEETLTLEIHLFGYHTKEFVVSRNETGYIEFPMQIDKDAQKRSALMGAVTIIEAQELTSKPNAWQRFKYKVGQLSIDALFSAIRFW
ncbi:carboxypeptidase-like regulatory domain-containing protein [Chitinophaga filiformis]|uniref:CarboxypepD_reg-like domain-containing protein n=1 Tax=Chitinophaga filiformis TaxID=104663 RepID=A0A1G7U9A0_CHIFI|nr:carboxypeptidase-like regulatory domain-containing protein [Chitinophaga filiformis]SDG44017.1 CarboxypepD_reg-like domain-containing protein [Chitinophaga filiformis]